MHRALQSWYFLATKFYTPWFRVLCQNWHDAAPSILNGKSSKIQTRLTSAEDTHCHLSVSFSLYSGQQFFLYFSKIDIDGWPKLKERAEFLSMSDVVCSQGSNLKETAVFLRTFFKMLSVLMIWTWRIRLPILIFLIGLQKKELTFYGKT